MTKVCLNCHSRNSGKSIRCKECGASLVRALEVRDGPNLTPLLLLVAVVLVVVAVVWGPQLMSMVGV